MRVKRAPARRIGMIAGPGRPAFAANTGKRADRIVLTQGNTGRGWQALRAMRNMRRSGQTMRIRIDEADAGTRAGLRNGLFFYLLIMIRHPIEMA